MDREDGSSSADIDQLLDHIESVYSNGQSQLALPEPKLMLAQCGTSCPRPNFVVDRQFGAGDESDLSDLMEDTRSATELYLKSEHEPGNDNYQLSHDAPCAIDGRIQERQRCFPTYLSGSSVDVGFNTASGTCSTFAYPRACSNLRCIDCDFLVIRLDECAWHSSIDYLFLRNHMPDLDKLRTGLVTKKGFRAYACQCAWRNIELLVDIKSHPTLKWICGKH